MNIAQAHEWLSRRTNREAIAGVTSELTLEPTQRVLHVLGDPHRNYPAIHITGTNGKGSVARMASAILQSHGIAVGTYTSPHLHVVNERLRWNDDAVTDDQFAELIATIADAETLAGVTLSWFEAMTCAALTWFAEVAVDVAVVEVGLLGQFDATNVIDASVAVLTNVTRDHTNGAGDWRTAIAREKLAVVGPDSWLVVGEPDEIEHVLTEVQAASIWRGGEEFELLENRTAVGGRLIDVRTPHEQITELFVPVHGEHQGQNAAVAIAAVSAFFGRELSETAVGDGLATIELPARFELLGRAPLVIVDGAHNPAAVAATLQAFDDDFAVDGRGHLVVGMLADKDVALVLDQLEPARWHRIVCTTPPSTRALPASELAGLVAARGAVAEVIEDPATAVRDVARSARDDDAVLVIGSLYLAAAAREVLRTA